MRDIKVFAIVFFMYLGAVAFVGAQNDQAQEPDALISDSDLKAMVYKPDFGIPSPLPVLRVGFPYLNYFMPEAWTSGLFGISWGAVYFNLGEISVRNIGISTYYGIGGMRFIDDPGNVDLEYQTQRNHNDFFWGAISYELDIINGFSITNMLSGAISSTQENNYWAADLGISWQNYENPHLPDDGQKLGLLSHWAMVRQSLTPGIGLNWKYFLGTDNPGNALGITIDLRSVLGASPRGDGSIAYMANNLVYWDPLIIEGNQGHVFLGEQAISFELAYRLRYFRLNSIIDNGKSEVPWVNVLHAYLEPFIFAAAQRSGEDIHLSYGFGLRNLFATVTGPYSTPPLVVGASVDFGGWEDGTWLSLLLDF